MSCFASWPFLKCHCILSVTFNQSKVWQRQPLHQMPMFSVLFGVNLSHYITWQDTHHPVSYDKRYNWLVIWQGSHHHEVWSPLLCQSFILCHMTRHISSCHVTRPTFGLSYDKVFITLKYSIPFNVNPSPCVIWQGTHHPVSYDKADLRKYDKCCILVCFLLFNANFKVFQINYPN